MTLFSKLETCSRCSPRACSIVRQVLSDIITQIFISKAVKTRKTVRNLDNKFVKVLASGKHLILFSYDGCYL